MLFLSPGTLLKLTVPPICMLLYCVVGNTMGKTQAPWVYVDRASRHEGSSSGSNDPIGDLEARVEQLQSELRHRNRAQSRTVTV
jgi:hypothetical protein